MRKDEKNQIIGALAEKFKSYNHFYLTDVSTLTVEKTSQLRRMCFSKGVSMQVAKNTLIKKAMEHSGNSYEELFDTLKGSTAIMFSEIDNAPAKLMKEFRKTSDRPILKGAYIASEIYLGDKELTNLANIKSKNELIGDIIGMLQSPARTVISGLLEHARKQGGGETTETTNE